MWPCCWSAWPVCCCRCFPDGLLIFVGLGILATEYVWAQRLLKTAKEKANQAKDKVLRKKNNKQQ